MGYGCLAYQTHGWTGCRHRVAMSSGNLLCISLGRRIRSLRKGKAWTQVEMAEYLGINRGHLSDIELGKREVGLLMLQVIARGLDTTMSRLLKGL
jgi:DNA-binding XRE family transcriptional regulator